MQRPTHLEGAHGERWQWPERYTAQYGVHAVHEGAPTPSAIVSLPNKAEEQQLRAIIRILPGLRLPAEEAGVRGQCPHPGAPQRHALHLGQVHRSNRELLRNSRGRCPFLATSNSSQVLRLAG